MARTNGRQVLGLAFGVALLASVPGVHTQAQEKQLDRTPESCIMASSIRRKIAIDNKTIVFFMKSDRFFRTDLPAACAILSPGDTTRIVFNYRTQSVKLTRLCNYDSITVENRVGLACPLAKFNPITAEEAAQLTGEPVATPEVKAPDPQP